MRTSQMSAKNKLNLTIIMGVMTAILAVFNPGAAISSSVSTSGTTIPPAVQIIDSQNNAWTLSASNAVLINGSLAGYSSSVVMLLYYNGVMYQENSAGGWWSWAAGNWTACNDPRSSASGQSGVCGSANGVAANSAPTANLCSSGTPTAISGSGPWGWDCNGTAGGSDAFCSAPLPQNSSVSLSGTTIPPASQIVDIQNNRWALSSTNTVLENGKPAGYTNNVALVLYYNGVIYQKNSAGGWWSWTNGAWLGCSNPNPSVSGVCGSANGSSLSSVPTVNLCSSGVPTAVSGSGPWSWSCNGTNGGGNASCLASLVQNAVVSASGTTIPSAPQIVDSQYNKWTISLANAVLENGSPAGFSSSVALILYYNGVIYQKNSAGSWWSWTNGSWGVSSDPRTSGPGVCGTANGVAVSSAPTSNLCATGSSSAVSGNGTLWYWTCNSINGGTSTSCSAPVQPAAVNGVCGASNGVAIISAPTTNLCSSGVPTSVSGSGPWSWSCDGTSGGSDVSCSAPLKQSVSASGTTVPSASQIVDSQSNIWTLSSISSVLMNGNPAGYSSNVSLILYYNSVIYQKNSSGGWWSWTNGAWLISSDPRSGICGAANGVAVSSAPTANLCNGGTTSAVSGSGPWTWNCTGSNGITAQCSAPSTAVLNNLFGVNLAGAEFGQNFPGTEGLDYAYPTSTELDYYKNKGLTLIRIPFAWERMQPTLNGPLSSTEVGFMTNFLNAADARGMSVILDVHNYGRYGIGSFSDFTSHGNIIGSIQVPVSAFANLWSQLASQFKGHPSLMGYDIMNEPHDMGGAGIWPIAAQAAVNAIRTVDASHTIFVEGDGWAGAWSWMTYNANLNINDSSGNLVYEAHQYFDSDSSGTYTSSYTSEGAYPTVGVDRLQPFASWLTQHNKKGWVGEYGVPNNDSRWLTVLNNFIGALKSNGIWGTYWAGGPWWGSYPLSCEPSSGQDAVQMGVLKNYPSS